MLYQYWCLLVLNPKHASSGIWLCGVVDKVNALELKEATCANVLGTHATPFQ